MSVDFVPGRVAGGFFCLAVLPSPVLKLEKKVSHLALLRRVRRDAGLFLFLYLMGFYNLLEPVFLLMLIRLFARPYARWVHYSMRAIRVFRPLKMPVE